MRISDWSSDVCSSDLIAQVDLAVFGRPDEIGGTSINMLDHRKARAAGAAVIVRRQADAVADAVANQGGAARGKRGHQDFAFAGGLHGLIHHFEYARQWVDMQRSLRERESTGLNSSH